MRIREKRKSKAGFSLIEVVASIAISAILFSMIYSGFDSHRSQIKRAGQIIECTNLLDRKLTEWSSGSHETKIAHQGWLDEKGRISWEVKPLPTQDSLRNIGVARYRIIAAKGERTICFLEVLWETSMFQSLDE